jgi:hypothetical protein
LEKFMKKFFAAALVAAFFAAPAIAATDWDNQCASFGLSPGTAGFNHCVAKMAAAYGANRTANGIAATQQPWVGQAPQRGVSIVGSWSAGEPQNGTAFAFNPDGTYVNVSGNPNMAQRLWGRYRAAVSGNTVHIDFQVQGWAPKQMCVQVIGGAHACRPYSPTYSDNVTVTFTSPSTFEVGGTQFLRDPSPYLLQMQVPAVIESQIANSAPPMRQPVMPTLHPYQTPGGAGSIGAMRYDDEHQQPYRVCSVNGGTVYTDQNGVQHCSN